MMDGRTVEATLTPPVVVQDDPGFFFITSSGKQREYDINLVKAASLSIAARKPVDTLVAGAIRRSRTIIVSAGPFGKA